jgi:hypothetical protein
MKAYSGQRKNMGGVDTTDAIMKAYSGQRKYKKVHKKIILHLFHRILHNAYILYQKNTSDNPVKSRVKFLQSIVEDFEFKTQFLIPLCILDEAWYILCVALFHIVYMLFCCAFFDLLVSYPNKCNNPFLSYRAN